MPPPAARLTGSRPAPRVRPLPPAPRRGGKAQVPRPCHRGAELGGPQPDRRKEDSDPQHQLHLLRPRSALAGWATSWTRHGWEGLASPSPGLSGRGCLRDINQRRLVPRFRRGPPGLLLALRRGQGTGRGALGFPGGRGSQRKEFLPAGGEGVQGAQQAPPPTTAAPEGAHPGPPALLPETHG